MAVRKHYLPCFLSLLFMSALVPKAAAQTPDDVVEKHLAAVGGRAALGTITSRRSTGTILVGTPNGDIPGMIEVDNKAPNKSRQSMQLDLSAMGVPDKMTLERKFDGTRGVTLDSMQGDSEVKGNQLDNLRNNMFPNALLAYKANGVTLELLPKEQIDGKAVVVLRATPKTGSSTKLFLDADTYLLIRTVATINSSQTGGDIEQTSNFSDYRVVDGVKIAFQIVNSSPLQTATITFTKVEHNVPLEDALFSAKSPVR